MFSLLPKREDEIAFFESYGYEAIPDSHRGGGWCKYQKGNVHIWSCRKGWARANLINGRFVNHIWGSKEKVVLDKQKTMI